MAFLEVGGKRHTVPAGEMLIGTGADCHLRLEGPGIALRHAVLATAPDQSVSIRKVAPEAAVEVNGVALAGLPQSLLHGDKVSIGGVDLVFLDERKSGSTQYISAVQLPDAPAGKKPAHPGKATAATGGRVVSLTDGREYQIIGGSLKFGRDANSDVVVAGGQVSRRHCEILATPRGYVLVDSSTNGTFVNGERVQNQRLLARADIVRMGEEEFRFYADMAPEPPKEPSPPPPGSAAPPAPSSVTPPAAHGQPHGAAQLISTGYFQSPPRPSSTVSPRTGEDMALPEAPRSAPPQGPGRSAPQAAPARPGAGAAPASSQAVTPPEAPAVPMAPRMAPAAPPAAPAVPPRAQAVPAAHPPAKPAAPPAGAPPSRPAAPPAGAPPSRPAAPPAAAPVPRPQAPAAPAPAAPRAQAAPPAPTPAPPGAAPAAAARATPSALAKFLVRSGSLKGQRLYVKVPIVNIGRADYNDLIIPDDSVSSQHAKLTRREGVWILTDLGSTNGTMVDGEPVRDDVPIAPGAYVRFGEVQLIFEPTDDQAGIQKGGSTRMISAVDPKSLKPPSGQR